MSTPLMPELPALPQTHIMLLSDLQSGTDPGFTTWHMQQYARAYGLAVWKAAIEAAADAVTYPVGTPWWLPPPAHKVVRALATLPESDMTQARGE